MAQGFRADAVLYYLVFGVQLAGILKQNVITKIVPFIAQH